MFISAFFYLKIAQNIVEYGNSTFNNITLTNGYHPLWMLVLLAPAKLFSFDNNVFLIFVILLQIIFAIISINYLFKLLVDDFQKRFLYLIIPLLLIYLIPIGTLGSELHLNLMLQIIVIYLFWKAEYKNYYVVGFLLALIFLVRLDNVFFISVFGIYLLMTIPKKDRFNAFIKIGLIFILTIAPYFISNLHYFGALVPISGKIKSTFPHPVFNFGALGSFGTLIVFLNIIILFYSLKNRKDRLMKLTLIISSVCLLHSSYTVLFTNHHTFWSWYYSSGYLNILLL